MDIEPGPMLMGCVRVRPYRPKDRGEVLRLYDHGLLVGQISPYDNAADLQHIERYYFGLPHNYFWVTELQGEVVGMVGVAEKQGTVAKIRRLRVDSALQSTTLPCWLVETAVNHCREHGYLKVVMNTHAHTERKLKLLVGLGFQHNRTRMVDGKEMMEFYVNLYQEPDHQIVNREKERTEVNNQGLSSLVPTNKEQTS